jgi:two-component system cell cycle sensor histidine kinase/response regulator CckA
VVARSLSTRGFDVVAVATAAEALRTFDAARPPFELLVTDVYLPGRNGVELVGALEKRRPDLPVVFLSGHARDAEALSARVERAVLLPKPFGGQELERAVLRVLREARRDDDDDGQGPGLLRRGARG